MKKNKAMRLASILLVVTLLTTCAISGTFAKYTTQDSASDAARVAKWGVALQVAGNLYGETYKDAIVADNDATLTVQAKDYATADDDVVAPGTKNDSGVSVKLSGTPEVSGTVDITVEYENIYLKQANYGVMIKLGKISNDLYTATMAATNDYDKLFILDGTTYKLPTAYDANTDYYTLEDYVAMTADYYPVVYATTNFTTGTTAADSLASAVDDIVTNLGTAATTTTDAGKTTKTYSKAFNANDDLATVVGLADVNLKWAWAYGSATPAGDSAPESDKADTILGNLQAGLTVVKYDATAKTAAAPVAATGTEVKDYNLETAFSINITATQVD